MKRLTSKKIAKELKQNVETIITTTQNISRDVYLRYAEFEDFMEELGLDTVEELRKGYNDNFGFTQALITENQALKSRWQKLKEWIDNKMETIPDSEWLDFQEVWLEMQELEKE